MADNRNVNESLRLIADGNESALTELYETLKLRLTAVALYYTKNKDDAKDILQDTFVKVVQNACFFRGQNGTAWIEKICRNLCLNHLRKQKRRREVPEEALKDIADGGSGAEQVLIRHDIQSAFKQLSRQEFELISYFYYFDCSFKETAERMSLKQDTVYKIHKRAVAKLKARLKEGE